MLNDAFEPVLDTTFHEELMVGAAASDKRLPVVPERHCAKAPRVAVPHALSGWRVPDPGTAGSAVRLSGNQVGAPFGQDFRKGRPSPFA